MKPLTVRNGMYTIHTNYSVASNGYARYGVHTTEYCVCITKYLVITTSYTVHTIFYTMSTVRRPAELCAAARVVSMLIS